MRHRGVTLMEILVAISIMAVGVMTVLQLFPMGFAASAKSRFKTKAVQLAQRLVEEARVSRNPRGFGTVLSVDQLDTQYSFLVVPGESEYWYRIFCENIVDPAEKYMEYKLSNRDLSTLWRLTITVRGPMSAANDWYTIPAGRRKAVEVLFATYIADKFLCETYPTDTLGNQVGVPKGAKTIHVADIRPFTVFHPSTLTQNNLSVNDGEMFDTGPKKYKSYNPQTKVCEFMYNNDLRLDNIVIIDSTSGTGDINLAKFGYNDQIIDNKETNKVIDKNPDTGYSLPSDNAVPGTLTLLNAVRGRQSEVNLSNPMDAANYSDYPSGNTVVRPYICIKGG